MVCRAVPSLVKFLFRLTCIFQRIMHTACIFGSTIAGAGPYLRREQGCVSSLPHFCIVRISLVPDVTEMAELGRSGLYKTAYCPLS